MSSSTSGSLPSASILLPNFQQSLKSFAPSSSSFKVLHTIPASSTLPFPPKTLHVLDSSFNPPTLAHLRIAISALRSNATEPQRLLLLLATQNADKAPKPAPFEQRLVMMALFAQDIVDEYYASGRPSTAEDALVVEVGITKKPYFHDKATAIEESGYYSDSKTGEQPQQVHLLGFDSLIRLLDTKYYPPRHTLEPVDALLERHRIRVTRRTEDNDKWGSKAQQDRYWEALAKGDRETEGGKKEWAEKIEMVDGEGEAVSSTRVREAAGKGELGKLEKLISRSVRRWIENEGLYRANDENV
ncbi:MAG: hypothetical protein L6R41_004897 [Letrouitia leprolyta]|nr:MAG: hypothetical protein L6R41_004897 [Letrouitia leprolyta]